MYAIVGVNVVPMDTERVLPHHTVVIDGAAITALGPDGTVSVPEGAVVIDGTGRWLLPGLVDFHTHERALPEWPNDVAGNFIMDLANSITSIVNMGDFTGEMLPAQQSVRAGTLPGPEVYLGFFARGVADGGFAPNFVRDANDARALAERAAQQGYDFIKVYDRIPPAGFNALAVEGPARGLPILGHTNSQVSFSGILQAGQKMVVHAVAILDRGFNNSISPDLIPGVINTIKSNHASISATLYVSQVITDYGLDAIAGRPILDHVLAHEGVEFMDDRALTGWVAMLQSRPDLQQPWDRRPGLQFMKQFTKAFQDAGIPIMLGSDEIGIPGVVPGFAIHGEIQMLREAGLSPFEILATGTKNAGTFIRENLRPEEHFGTVAVGSRADLVLLDENPLNDLSTLRNPAGVMTAGRWYPGSWLREQLELLRTTR